MAPAPALVGVDSFVMQLSGLERDGAVSALARSEADLVIIDRVHTVKSLTGQPTAAIVRHVHARGGPSLRRKLCFAYLNAGQAEDYRTYFTDEFVLGPDPEGWPGNFPVAYWTPAWQRMLLREIDAIVAEGFDGVVLDWVAGYAVPMVTAAAKKAGVDPERAMAALVTKISKHARSRRPGFHVVPLNAAGLLEARPSLIPHVSGVLQEDVTFRGGASSVWDDPKNADVPIPETGDWSTATHRRRLSALKERGLVILTIDYAATPANVKAANDFARENGFIPFVSRTPLDRLPVAYRF
jgi:cysteinyl-tRNA synthetase